MKKIGTAACIHFADLVFPGSELQASDQQAPSISEPIKLRKVYTFERNNESWFFCGRKGRNATGGARRWSNRPLSLAGISDLIILPH
ncbi:hypothetical protein [Paenibacillus woosongensis]|uniref:Uncharacterized protein n=1 Tax=Paenibacillus woosongensis TaxID=307580 RepID=A0A7X2YXY7_9BACL|nr:hypothetical protein [Paenibacillus woosongensis]MUG43952.1 hypothetical protein [Paenibacillus woosongensis]